MDIFKTVLPLQKNCTSWFSRIEIDYLESFIKN
jgi:hypothetical protein